METLKNLEVVEKGVNRGVEVGLDPGAVLFDCDAELVEPLPPPFVKLE